MRTSIFVCLILVFATVMAYVAAPVAAQQLTGGQFGPVEFVAYDPAGLCNPSFVELSVNKLTGHIFACVNGVWTQLGTAAMVGVSPAFTGTATFVNSSNTGTLQVAGTSTLGAVTASTVAASGAVTAATTLAVTGATTLSSTLAAGASSLGATTVSSTLGVTGATTLSGTLSAGASSLGATTLSSSLTLPSGAVTGYSVGSQLTAAATLTITNPVHHVTNSAVTISTISQAILPTGGGCITLIPDANMANATTSTGGNIALASTFIANKPLVLCLDPNTAKYYPSY